MLDDAAQTSADEMGAILERLWKNAEEQENDQLRLTAGIPLAYRLDIEQNVPAARSVWRTLASVQRRNVGLEDPYSSLVMTYALTYWKKGRWKTSPDRFKQSARILLNIKGDDNFSMQELTAANQLDLLVVAEASLRELAARYRSYEDDASLDRLFIYAVAVAITEKIAGPHHPFTASCVNVLARRLQDEGFHEAAEKLCKLALDARERGLGPEHPLVAQSLNNLGLSQVCLGRLDEAEPVLLRAAAIDKRFSNPHYWLGRLYKSRKSPDDRRKEATAWQRYLELGGWKEREEEARSRLKELSL